LLRDLQARLGQRDVSVEVVGQPHQELIEEGVGARDRTVHDAHRIGPRGCAKRLGRGERAGLLADPAHDDH
jgi:hypothetical protein